MRMAHPTASQSSQRATISATAFCLRLSRRGLIALLFAPNTHTLLHRLPPGQCWLTLFTVSTFILSAAAQAVVAMRGPYASDAAPHANAPKNARHTSRQMLQCKEAGHNHATQTEREEQ